MWWASSMRYLNVVLKLSAEGRSALPGRNGRVTWRFGTPADFCLAAAPRSDHHRRLDSRCLSAAHVAQDRRLPSRDAPQEHDRVDVVLSNGVSDAVVVAVGDRQSQG